MCLRVGGGGRLFLTFCGYDTIQALYSVRIDCTIGVG